MDIAKIRKKAREKEEKRKDAGSGTPSQASPETPAEPSFQGEADREVHEGTDEEASLLLGDEEKTREAIPPSSGEEAAQRPAETKEAPDEEEGALELLTFSLSSEEFAFRVSQVEEIIRFQRITWVPTMPAYVRGITSLRGKIIPVIDLKSRLSLKGSDEAAQEKGESKRDSRILILTGPKGMIGATIDKVLGVVRFPAGTILDPPAHLTESEIKYIEGVVILEKRFISIVRSDDALDIEFILGGV